MSLKNTLTLTLRPRTSFARLVATGIKSMATPAVARGKSWRTLRCKTSGTSAVATLSNATLVMWRETGSWQSRVAILSSCLLIRIPKHPATMVVLSCPKHSRRRRETSCPVIAVGYSTAATSTGAVGCPSNWCTHSMATDAPHESSGGNWPSSPSKLGHAVVRHSVGRRLRVVQQQQPRCLNVRGHQGFGPTKLDESWPPIPDVLVSLVGLFGSWNASRPRPDELTTLPSESMQVL